MQSSKCNVNNFYFFKWNVTLLCAGDQLENKCR